MGCGKFYVVATPIGNLKDITIRALEILKEVDTIICEDTRVTMKLLEKYDIRSKLLSYHKYNEKRRTQEIIESLKIGNNIAIVTDAGTPCISDPGCVILEELYQNDIYPIIIPGVSAVTSFLSVLPRITEEFTFIGFMPKKISLQQYVFEKFKFSDFIFYESPNRLISTLENLSNSRSGNCKIAVGRELTKIHEEIKIGTVAEILKYYEVSTLKGEIVVMCYSDEIVAEEENAVLDKISKLKLKNFSNKDIAVILSELFGYNKNRVYTLSNTTKK